MSNSLSRKRTLTCTRICLVFHERCLLCSSKTFTNLVKFNVKFENWHRFGIYFSKKKFHSIFPLVWNSIPDCGVFPVWNSIPWNDMEWDGIWNEMHSLDIGHPDLTMQWRCLSNLFTVWCIA